MNDANRPGSIPPTVDYRPVVELSRAGRLWRRWGRTLLAVALVISTGATLYIGRSLQEWAVQRELQRWSQWHLLAKNERLTGEEGAEMLAAAPRALRSRDDRVFITACSTLESFFSPRFVQRVEPIALERELRQATLDADPRRRWHAARAFLRVARKHEEPGEKTFARVVALLDDPDLTTSVEAGAVMVLWAGGEGRRDTQLLSTVPPDELTPFQSRARAVIVPWLLERLEDPNPLKRVSAMTDMRALLPQAEGSLRFEPIPTPDAGRSVFDPEIALPKLSALLADPNQAYGRTEVARTIALFGSEAVPLLPILEEALREVARSGDTSGHATRLKWNLQRAMDVIRRSAERDGVPIEPVLSDRASARE